MRQVSQRHRRPDLPGPQAHHYHHHLVQLVDFLVEHPFQHHHVVQRRPQLDVCLLHRCLHHLHLDPGARPDLPCRQHHHQGCADQHPDPDRGPRQRRCPGRPCRCSGCFRSCRLRCPVVNLNAFEVLDEEHAPLTSQHRFLERSTNGDSISFCENASRDYPSTHPHLFFFVLCRMLLRLIMFSVELPCSAQHLRTLMARSLVDFTTFGVCFWYGRLSYHRLCVVDRDELSILPPLFTF